MRLATWATKIKLIDGKLYLNVSDFKRSITKYCNYIESHDEVITLLERGKPKVVLMSCKHYDEMMSYIQAGEKYES